MRYMGRCNCFVFSLCFALFYCAGYIIYCNFIRGLSDAIINTFSSVSQSHLCTPCLRCGLIMMMTMIIAHRVTSHVMASKE